MLIWIKVPYVAIGVLASFVLLLSTVVSEQRDQSASFDDISNTFSTLEVLDTVKIMDLPFAQSLRNPCSWDTSYSTPRHLTFMGSRAKFIQEFFTFVRHYARIYKEDVQSMLSRHSISSCGDLYVENLPDTPTLEELKEMDMEEALNKIYLSLLVHSAYSFIIHYQVNSTDIRCSKDIEEERNLANQSYTMALKEKALACYVLVGITVLGYQKEDISPLLNGRVSQLSQCSRRAFRECQVLNSARRFFQILYNYSVEDNRKSSNHFNPPTVSAVPISYSTTALTSSLTPISSSAVTSRPSIASTSPIISTSSSFLSTPSSEIIE